MPVHQVAAVAHEEGVRAGVLYDENNVPRKEPRLLV
jgi:hypothetical protein